MASLIVAGVSIPIAVSGPRRDYVDGVDRRRAFDLTYRASATGNGKRDFSFSTTPLKRDHADLYEMILRSVTPHSVTGDLPGGSQNLFTAPEDFSNAAWSKTNVTITPNAAQSPIGDVTTDKIEATASANTILSQSVAVAATSATLSAFIRKGSGATDANLFGIRNMSAPADLIYVSINYDTGVISYIVGSIGASIEVFGLYYRLALSVSAGITSGNTLRGDICFNGNAETAGEFAYIWGAQLDPVGTLRSYAPATTTLTGTYYPKVTNWTPVKTAQGHRVVLDFDLCEA